MRSIAVGTLSDGRLQLFASDSISGEIWSSWKQTADPNADWSNWSPFQLPNINDFPDIGWIKPVVLPSGVLQLFALYNNGIAKIRKVSIDSNSGWSEWENFYKPSLENVDDCAVGALSDSRLQVIVSHEGVDRRPGQLLTTWMETSDDDAPWTEMSPFQPEPPEMLDGITLARLSFFRLQLWGVSAIFPPKIWTTWKESDDADSPWVPWSDFSLPNNTPVTRLPGISVGRLSAGGRLQVWVRRRDTPELYSRWQSQVGVVGSWSEWQPFPHPTGETIINIVAAQLPDLRLQIWGVSDSDRIYTAWKLSESPDSPWSDWSLFRPPWIHEG